jgi:hypothetical protein
MPAASAHRIKQWERRMKFQKTPAAVRDMLSQSLASMCLGRAFLESVDAYIERKGLSEAVAWARVKMEELSK